MGRPFKKDKKKDSYHFWIGYQKTLFFDIYLMLLDVFIGFGMVLDVLGS